MRFIKYLICFFCFCGTHSFAQDYYSIDSLRHFENRALHFYKQDSTQTEIYKNKIFDIYYHSNNPTLQFYTCSIIGNLYRLESNYNLAINFYSKALKLSSSSISELDIALIYDNLARIYLIKGETGLLFENINKSLLIKKEFDDKKGIHLTHTILSDYYRKTGNYTEVLSNYFNALNYFINTKDSLEIARAYNRIGITYKTFKNHSKALHYYKLSETYYKAINSKKGESTILNNIGAIQLVNENYQEALGNFQKSLAIEQELGNISQSYTRYNNIGLAYIYLGNFREARFYIDQCITYYRKIGSKTKLTNSYETLAQFHEAIGNNDSTEFYYLKTYKLAQELDYISLARKCADKLSQRYASRGDFQNAYVYHLASSQISEVLNSVENIHGITEEELVYLRMKDQELIEANKRYSRYKFIVWAGALFILMLLLLIAVAVQLHRVRLGKKIATELRYEVETKQEKLHDQGKELMSKILQLGSNNSEVSFVINQLETLKAELGVQGKQKIQHIIINLEQHQNKDIWNEFEIRFSQVNTKFYESLAKLFPMLTSNEKRLASLIFLNFSTKEISQITKQSYRSILVAKSRLRKRLSLEQNEELTTFLTKLSTLQHTPFQKDKL